MSVSGAIAVLDCNNFFVSSERAVNPKLLSRPVVVLSNNDGCIISRSNEVKAFGVKMAEPLFQVRELLERHNTAVISCNHALYREFADQIHNILIKDLGKNAVELYSIDEAFLDIDPPDKLGLLGKHLKQTVFEKTKIPVSVGIAETKTLAKIANHISKVSVKTRGVLDLYRSPYVDAALRRTSVEDVWGIGPRSAARLKEANINTALDLKHTNPEQIGNEMSVVRARTVMELNGIKCIPLEITERDNRSIAHTRTFGRTVGSFYEIKNAVFYFTTRALEKMRWNNLMAGNVTVFLQTDRFRTGPNYYSNAYLYDSVYHSDVTSEIYKWVSICLEKTFRPGLQYKRAGIVLGDLLPIAAVPPRLFDQHDFECRHRLVRSMDELNLRYGRDVVHFAVLNEKGSWQSQSTHRINDENHTVGRDKLGLGHTFSKPIRFL
jgi:DNA polymerase V